MVDPLHFDRHAEVYERARPPYPDALWARLAGLGLLSRGDRVLDLGAGTGQAAGRLLGFGMQVTAVEPGPALAARLRSALSAVEVIESTIEGASLTDGGYELAVAATSVHWFDLPVVLPKLHRALVSGGHFAVWRTVFGDPSAEVTPFREQVARIVAPRTAPPRPGPSESATASWADELVSGGWFRVVDRVEFPWRIELDADQIRDLFTTFSDWSLSEVEQAAAAVRDLGGTVTEHYLTPLIVLERVPGSDLA
ncbi:class I SAM-dependent methyltransferase [Leifsonia sp. NPDC058292]|uniref:class I SAM-dependent methyltransferase n=1 Tax=Leifsonia sp. NPDC058292 TaxID=3346428 RepID=UPI0036DD541F